MKRILLILLLLSFVFLTGCSNYKEEYEELYDQYTDLEALYYEDTSRLERNIEDLYTRIQNTDDSITVLYEYFVEENTTFDKAYDAFDDLLTILSSFY